jgi:hypothetical protein
MIKCVCAHLAAAVTTERDQCWEDLSRLRFLKISMRLISQKDWTMSISYVNKDVDMIILDKIARVFSGRND